MAEPYFFKFIETVQLCKKTVESCKYVWLSHHISPQYQENNLYLTTTAPMTLYSVRKTIYVLINDSLLCLVSIFVIMTIQSIALLLYIKSICIWVLGSLRANVKIRGDIQTATLRHTHIHTTT